MATNQPETNRKELKRLRSQSATYTEYLPKWKFYVDAVEGGEAFANKTNLHRHVREHEEDFYARAKRVFYDNILEGLVAFFTDFIFSETILRDGGKQDNTFYQNFLKDVDKQGNDIETFMRELSDDMQVFGMMYIIVDNPPIPEHVQTKQDEIDFGIRPYWIAVRPDEMLDWVVDPFNKLQYAKRCQMVEEFDPASGTVKHFERYTEWTTETIRVTDVDISKPSTPVVLPAVTIDNQLHEIPIQIVRFRKSKTNSFMGLSFLRDLAFAAKAILNLNSLNDEFLYRQCFNILAMEAEESLPFKEQEEGEQGTANALIFPKGAKVPQYITPSAEPAKYITDTMQRIEAAMFKRASQDMMNELFNGAKSSGFSKSMSFSKTVPKIASRADILEKAEMNLMRLTMKFMGKTWQGSVKYKDRYEITSLTDWLTQLSIVFSDLGFESETFMKTQFKKLAAQFDGKFTTDELTKVHAEIDKIDFEQWFEKVGPQLDQQTISPAAQQKPKQDGALGTIAQQATQQNSKDVTSATKRVRRNSNAN